LNQIEATASQMCEKYVTSSSNRGYDESRHTEDALQQEWFFWGGLAARAIGRFIAHP